jgi:hypothetical protein
MPLLLASTWVIVVRTVIPTMAATGNLGNLIVTVIPAVAAAAAAVVAVTVTGTVTPTAVTIGTGVIVVALPLGVTPLTTTGVVGAIQEAPLVVVARPVLVNTTHLRVLPQDRVNRLVGKGS